MALLQKIAGGLRSLFGRKRAEREMDAELREFLEMAAEEKMKQGMSREEAMRAVRLERGSLDVTKEEVRAAGWESALENLWRDIRYAFRGLRKNPGFTAVAVVTLALGIGANTAIFTLVNAVMLKTLPVANPSELYRLGDNNNCCVMAGTQNYGSFVLYSYPLYQELREHTPEFSELAAFEPYVSDLSVRRGSSAAAAYKGEFVSGNYFPMFGIQPFAGRLLTPSDDTAAAPRTVVMGYHAWQKHFGADRSVIGSTIAINGAPYTIAGIAAPEFYGDTLRSDTPDFWLPLVDEPEEWRFKGAEIEWLYLIGRLKPGEKPETVQAGLTVQLQGWLNSHREVIPERDRNEIPQQHIRIVSAARGVEQMQTDYATGLRLLLTLSGLLLLIACANIANLLLVRGSASRSPMAVRMALGAPRSRLIRQMLTESVLLALAGGMAGLYVAHAGTRAILLIAFRGAHFVPIEARPSPIVLCFAIVLSLATGIIFGIAPAWMASQSHPASALRGAGRSTGDRSSLVQKPLMVLQIAFSMVLLIGAGLVTQSLRNLEHQDFGFVTRGRLIVGIEPFLSGYTEDKLAGLYQRLEDTLPQIPGVISVSLSCYSPLGGNNWNEPVYIQGKAPDFRWTSPSWDRVGPHYFESIGTRLLQGREIDERDSETGPRVAVISETFARRYFPDENPIGRRFGMRDVKNNGDYEIVGIVEDAKYQDTRGPAYATFFLPLLQRAPGETLSGWVRSIELHAAGRPESLVPAVRKTLAELDPNLTVSEIVTFEEQVARNFNQERLIARLAELFGVLALILACIGLYGVTSYSVARRTGEIGMRMALGADRRSVLGLVLRGALAQLGLGLAIGIPAALAGGKVLANQLYGLKSYDAVVIGLAALVLVITAFVAAFVPARRATLVEPMVALRYE
jgi:predicted permease